MMRSVTGKHRILAEGKKSEIVWSQGDEVMNSETTPSDGRIDTTPIIQNYYDEYDALWNEIQEEYAEKSANESSDKKKRYLYG